MKLIVICGIILLLFFFLIAIGCERKVVYEVTEEIIKPPIPQYIGSQVCGGAECHGTIYETFNRTGHPYILNAADDALTGNYYPYTDLPGAPPAYSEADFIYVIGGFWRKAVFIDNGGYVLTGDEAQYYFESSEWVSYHADQAPGTKQYDCAECHTTGFNPEGNQDDLLGIEGTWTLPGVQCEACHGPGDLHVLDPRNSGMAIDRSAEACGKCHSRGNSSGLRADGGFIANYQQWNEISTTKHVSLDCIDCHDPHMGLHPSNPDRVTAIKHTCENCHFEELRSFKASIIDHYERGVQCLDCHMPYAVKSAVGDISRYQGDVRSHLMRINTDPEAELTSGNVANGYLTLDFTCLTSGCHFGVTKEWVSRFTHEIHKDPSVAGSD